MGAIGTEPDVLAFRGPADPTELQIRFGQGPRRGVAMVPEAPHALARLSCFGRGTDPPSPEPVAKPQVDVGWLVERLRRQYARRASL